MITDFLQWELSPNNFYNLTLEFHQNTDFISKYKIINKFDQLSPAQKPIHYKEAEPC